MYILITAANSAEAYKLKATLKNADILLGDYEPLPELMVNTGRMIRLPDPATASYLHQMLKLCLDKGINTIYARRQQERLLLAEGEQLFNEYNIRLILTDDKI